LYETADLRAPFTLVESSGKAVYLLIPRDGRYMDATASVTIIQKKASLMCNHETREIGAQSLARAAAWDQAHLYSTS
jgi:hypothetical protein